MEATYSKVRKKKIFFFFHSCLSSCPGGIYLPCGVMLLRAWGYSWCKCSRLLKFCCSIPVLQCLPSPQWAEGGSPCWVEARGREPTQKKHGDGLVCDYLMHRDTPSSHQTSLIKHRFKMKSLRILRQRQQRFGPHSKHRFLGR